MILLLSRLKREAKILLKGYKSYQDAALPLSPLTVLIGANASGKSNALEAFRLLCWLAEGQKLSIIKQEVNDSGQLLRGKKPQLTCTDQIAIMCQLESSAKFEGGHKKAQKEIPATTRMYQSLLKNTLFLDPVPTLMRGDSFPEKKIARQLLEFIRCTLFPLPT